MDFNLDMWKTHSPHSPPPATPNVGTTEEPDHPAYQRPKAVTPATGPMTVSEANARMPKAASEKGATIWLAVNQNVQPAWLRIAGAFQI